MTFFLAMILHPDIQTLARAELDALTHGTRLPVSADAPNLPYIAAIVKETHRWHPVVPMAIPHASSREQEVRGYRIPEGAVLIPYV
jgi:cytochrome P450